MLPDTWCGSWVCAVPGAGLTDLTDPFQINIFYDSMILLSSPTFIHKTKKATTYIYIIYIFVLYILIYNYMCYIYYMYLYKYIFIL